MVLQMLVWLSLMVAGLGVQRETGPEVKSLMSVKEWPRTWEVTAMSKGSGRCARPSEKAVPRRVAE